MTTALDILGGAIGHPRGRWLWFREPEFAYRWRLVAALMERPGVSVDFAFKLIDIAEGRIA